MIVQESKEGITVRIEVMGVIMGPEERATVGTVALWIIGFVCGSKGLQLQARHVFNNGVRHHFLNLATTTKTLWQGLVR